MSVFTALNTGVTGLGSNGLALEVIGDNIANLNTTAFKSGRAEFRDLMFQDVAVAGARGQLGLGSFLGGIGETFGQGSLQTTSRDTDFAVNGDGFFVFRDAAGTPLYSRAGALTLAADGTLVNGAGMVLQGYPADASGNVSSSLGDLVIDRTPLAAQATTEVVIDGNLDPDADIGTSWVGALPTTLEEADAAATARTSMTIYDSLGAAHTLDVYFVKTGSDTWEYYAAVDASEIDPPGTEGDLSLVAQGDLTFDGDGNLTALNEVVPPSVTFEGASPLTFDLDLGDPADTSTEGSLTHYGDGAAGGDSASSFTRLHQDGYASGDYASFALEPDGTVTAVYDNGETRTIGRLALATFASTAGLERAGNSMYAAGKASGEPLLGAAGEGGRGDVYAYMLEASNVDLEEQFVQMITAQRGYEASAKVISTADEMLQTLTNVL